MLAMGSAKLEAMKETPYLLTPQSPWWPSKMYQGKMLMLNKQRDLKVKL